MSEATQSTLFDITRMPRLYHDSITAFENGKGCMDVDTVKGCSAGMQGEPDGCYGECYAAKIANRAASSSGTASLVVSSTSTNTATSSCASFERTG